MTLTNTNVQLGHLIAYLIGLVWFSSVDFHPFCFDNTLLRNQKWLL